LEENPMTQYLMAVHGREGEPMPAEEEMQAAYAAVEVFNTELREKGVWVFAGGLMPVDTATVVDGRGAETVLSDGPFAETKEHLGGFWVIEVANLDEALRWAAAGSKACGGQVEVRAFQSV
jgi:hypothetical protein